MSDLLLYDEMIQSTHHCLCPSSLSSDSLGEEDVDAWAICTMASHSQRLKYVLNL